VFVGTVSPVGGPSGLPAVPGLLGRPGLGGQRASGGLGSLGLQEAGDTPTLMAVGVLCGPMEYRLWGGGTSGVPGSMSRQYVWDCLARNRPGGCLRGITHPWCSDGGSLRRVTGRRFAFGCCDLLGHGHTVGEGRRSGRHGWEVQGSGDGIVRGRAFRCGLAMNCREMRLNTQPRQAQQNETKRQQDRN
jgi:hypothetical protein